MNSNNRIIISDFINFPLLHQIAIQHIFKYHCLQFISKLNTEYSPSLLRAFFYFNYSLHFNNFQSIFIHSFIPSFPPNIDSVTEFENQVYWIISKLNEKAQDVEV